MRAESPEQFIASESACMGIYDRDYYREDELRPLMPWDGKSMVTLLIIANVVLFVANFLFFNRNNALTDLLVLHAADVTAPLQWYRLVTAGFAHGGVTHILFNMATLYFLGQNVEAKYGKWEFLRIYMVSLILCNLAWCGLHYASEPSQGVLGASGAVTTIAMLFVFSFPHATLYLYGAIPVKAWLLGVLMIVGNIFGTANYIAYDVHLVGAAFAAAYFYGNLNFGFMGRFVSQISDRSSARRAKLKVHRPVDSPSGAPDKDQEKADRILEKIHREGKDSLTAAESRFMEKYSRRIRQQRKR